ncbi:hypothetical protein LCGC14_0155960 [marine sediment metagenome]
MQIQINMQDDLVAALTARAVETNTTTEALIDELLREALHQPIAESTLVDNVLVAAVEGISLIESGKQFSLDDVIDQESWDGMTGGERKSLGKRFRKLVESQGIANWVDRTSGNKAIYVKL